MKNQIKYYLEKLFPINRSLTGDGNRDTLKIIQKIIPLKIKEINSGTKVYDWIVPEEWNIRDAYIKDNNGIRLISLKENNLHVMGYSKKFEGLLNWSELKKKLITSKVSKDSIPYRTSYYNKDWSFCVTQNQYALIKNSKGPFKIKIDSNHKKGSMSYGECIIKGKSKKEILISCYICHPSMANDSLSGILLCAFLATEILKKKRNWSYRIIFVPETIGAITYCRLNENIMKKIDTALVITTVGGPGKFGFKKSWDENHKINTEIKNLFRENKLKYIEYPFDIKGSDERQYSSIGFRINSATIAKDKYYEYSQYHTSKDDLNFVKPEYINQSLKIYTKLLKKIEKWEIYKSTNIYCEPMLSKRSLYNHVGGSYTKEKNKLYIMSWILFLSDGILTIDQISDKLKIKKKIIKEISEQLLNLGLLCKI